MVFPLFRYGERLWKLRVIEAEVRMNVRPPKSSSSHSVRFVISNLSGYVLCNWLDYLVHLDDRIYFFDVYSFSLSLCKVRRNSLSELSWNYIVINFNTSTIRYSMDIHIYKEVVDATTGVAFYKTYPGATHGPLHGVFWFTSLVVLNVFYPRK